MRVETDPGKVTIEFAATRSELIRFMWLLEELPENPTDEQKLEAVTKVFGKKVAARLNQQVVGFVMIEFPPLNLEQRFLKPIRPD